MLRTVSIYKPDVCNGDVAGERDYELDDNMTIPDFLRFIANHHLATYLHYRWEIHSYTPGHESITLGYIACNKPEDRPILKSPGEVVHFLNQQLCSDDLIQCCVPLEQTLRDLNVTFVDCINL